MTAPCKGRVPNTPLCIDAFHPSNVQSFLDTPLASSCQLLFFLSHLHADHTGGLSSSWQHGRLYTSHLNRQLLLSRFNLPPHLVTALHYNTPTLLPLSSLSPHPTFTLTLLPVSHCPGACLLVFDGYWGRLVYTGDMRWLAGGGLGGEGGALLTRPIDVLYLDNTYANARYQHFMGRQQVVEAVVEVIAAHGSGSACDVWLNSDLLGKEDVLVLIARRCRCLVAVDDDKYTMLKALHEAQYDLNDSCTASAADERAEDEQKRDDAAVSEEERLDAEALSYPSWFYRFTTNRADTFLHVVPKRLMTRKHVDEANATCSRDGRRPVVAVYMTGWAVDHQLRQQHDTGAAEESAVTQGRAAAPSSAAEATHASAPHSLSPRSPCRHCSGDATRPCGIHWLPYSSHSSYTELQAFLSHVRPRSILPISAPLTLTPSALYSAHLDATPPTAFTLPVELTCSALKDAARKKRMDRAAGHLQLVRRRRSEGWLSSKRRRAFALSSEAQDDELLTAPDRECDTEATVDEEEQAMLDLTMDDPPHPQPIELLSPLSPKDAHIRSPLVASSFRSLDDPIRHFSLRINPARRHLVARLSLTAFHAFELPATSFDPSSPPSRAASAVSAVTTLAVHTASLPIRRLPAFLTRSTQRRDSDSQPSAARPLSRVAVSSAQHPILHPRQLRHPWSSAASYSFSAAPHVTRHKLPLCADPSPAAHCVIDAQRDVTPAVHGFCSNEQRIGVSASLNIVSGSNSLGDVEMPPLELA